MRQPPAATGRESSETACPSALVPCALRTYGAPCRETSRSLSGPLCPVTVDLPFCHWILPHLRLGPLRLLLRPSRPSGCRRRRASRAVGSVRRQGRAPTPANTATALMVGDGLVACSGLVSCAWCALLQVTRVPLRVAVPRRGMQGWWPSELHPELRGERDGCWPYPGDPVDPITAKRSVVVDDEEDEVPVLRSSERVRLDLDLPSLVSACQERVSSGISALDPDGPDGGRRCMRWGLRVNVTVVREGAS